MNSALVTTQKLYGNQMLFSESERKWIFQLLSEDRKRSLFEIENPSNDKRTEITEVLTDLLIEFGVDKDGEITQFGTVIDNLIDRVEKK